MRTAPEILREKDYKQCSQLIKDLGVDRATFYKDIKFLEIQTTKDNKGQSYISNQDYERILLLREHIKNNGTRKGFKEEIGGELIIRNNTSMSKKDSDKLVREEPNYEDIYVEPEEKTAGFEDEFMRGAFELKAREIAMPDLVKRALADQITEEDLPEDLKGKVAMAREAANPKFSPSEVATTLLANYKRKSSI